MHLGVTDIDQWLTLLVGYKAIKFFTAAPAALFKNSNLVLSSKISI